MMNGSSIALITFDEREEASSVDSGRLARNISAAEERPRGVVLDHLQATVWEAAVWEAAVREAAVREAAVREAAVWDAVIREAAVRDAGGA